MAQLYKTPYKRYGVQMPMDLAEYIDKETERLKQSASQVIVEIVRKGATAEPEAQIHSLYDDQRALLEASRLAVTAVHGPQDERNISLELLLSHLLTAGMRKPTAIRGRDSGKDGFLRVKASECDLLDSQLKAGAAAESEQAGYGVTVPKAPKVPPAQRKKPA
jgi:hypothetical protein